MPKSRGRTRNDLHAAACLVLGIVTTIVVAWGLRLAPPIGMVSRAYSPLERPWITPIPRGQEAPTGVRINSALGLWYEQVERVDDRGDHGTIWYTVATERCGWPLHAFERIDDDAHVWSFKGPHRTRWRKNLHYGLALFTDQPPGSWPGDRVLSASGSRRRVAFLPCIPLWAGVAIDTCIYATTWWVLLFGIARATRWRRARRRRRSGLCAACGYNLAGVANSLCPECGALAGL